MALAILRQNIIFLWFEWQFFDVPGGILKGWRNYLKFNLNYFSVPILLRTFFSPWRRYSLGYGKGFNLGRYFEAFTFNVMSRIIGAVLRLFFIFLGLLTEILIILAGAVIFFGWLILPLLLATGIFYGFRILF
jgi:hypothetical protein